MILNCKRLIGELLEMSQDGLNSANVLRDMLANFVSHVHLDIDTVQPMEGHSCLVFLAIVISMQKFVILKLGDVSANIILQETIVINAQS